MPLEQAFSLTPRDSTFWSESGHHAHMYIHGSSMYSKRIAPRLAFDNLYQSDELFFSKWRAGYAGRDYTRNQNLRENPHVHLIYNLSNFGLHKDVALTFRYDAQTESRVLVYTEYELAGEEILHVGDNQFLIEVESTEFLRLNFVHVRFPGHYYGGDWCFQGIDGYIA